jgi:hypothetical protein
MSFCRKMDGAGDHHVKKNKPDSERQISRFLSYVESRPKTKQIQNKDMNVKGGLFWGEPKKRERVKGEVQWGVNMIEV